MVDLKYLTTAQREQVCREFLETSVKHAMGPIYLGQVLRGDEPKYITKEQRAVIDAAIAYFDPEMGEIILKISKLSNAVKNLEGAE